MNKNSQILVIVTVLLFVLGGLIFFTYLAFINGSFERNVLLPRDDSDEYDAGSEANEELSLNCNYKDLSIGSNIEWNINFKSNMPAVEIVSFKSDDVDSLCGITQISNNNVSLNMTIPAGQVGGVFTESDVSQFSKLTDFNLDISTDNSANSYIYSYMFNKDGKIYYTNTLLEDSAICKSTFLEFKDVDIKYCGIAVLKVTPDMNFSFVCEKEDSRLSSAEFKNECDEIVRNVEITRQL